MFVSLTPGLESRYVDDMISGDNQVKRPFELYMKSKLCLADRGLILKPRKPMKLNTGACSEHNLEDGKIIDDITLKISHGGIQIEFLNLLRKT